ncbi:MAG: DUF1501 domain-containing protein [Verrucomicrobia bacterium]|nr:DUF1501 domain-containing protein [Verrucomicrobiota bacterium]
MNTPNIITRRSFLDRSVKLGALGALAALTDIPFVVKRALAEGNIGGNGKKLLFIWLRGGNDVLSSIIPVQDPAYNASNRPTTVIPKDGLTDYSVGNIPCDFPVNSNAAAATFSYNSAIRLGNGFAALHPSLKFLAPVYNAGDLAVIHRVGYPRQSRSHFDSQNYWENGAPNNNFEKEGIFYRTMLEAIQQNTAKSTGLTGVTLQTALPLILRGSQAAMTNLTDPLRYDLLGIPNTSTNANAKAFGAVTNAAPFAFPDKLNRQLLSLQYANMTSTLQIFAAIDFTENGNTFLDDTALDGESAPYHLFPTTSAKNGGYAMHGNDTNKYVVPSNSAALFSNLKAAALILNRTDAIVAGTEFGGFDTHSAQGGATGAHANLQRQVAWALYSLRKFFRIYGKGGAQEMAGAQIGWNDLVIVTLSEFGRTTIENNSTGTDHAEGGGMLVAGGAVKGYGKPGATTGVFGCHTSDSVPWVNGPAGAAPANATGSMFGISNRYLKRAYDYRSVLGRIIRQHLGATQTQLNRIIPGYANESQEHLLSGGTVASPIESGSTTTAIMGEPDLLV